MKNAFIYLGILCIFFSLPTLAQSNSVKGNGNIVTKNITTSDYEDITVAGHFYVSLVQGTEGNIVVKGEENLLEHLIITTEGTALKIEADKNVQLKPSGKHKIEITVPVQTVSGISLAGSGEITSTTILKGNEIAIKLAGSGDINLTVEVTDLLTKMAGSGKIILTGKANTVTGKVAGSGDTDASKLQTATANISVTGSGNYSINCTDNLKARIAGSGNIRYSGNPQVKDFNTAGSGSIKAK